MEEPVIYIVGPMKLQNNLMANYLERATDIDCEAIEDASNIPSKSNGRANAKRLILWDCMETDLGTCLEAVSKVKRSQPYRDLVALFNIHRGKGGEEEGLDYDVRGFFYQGDPADHFVKGIEAIFNGELWLSRKIMTHYIVNNHRQSFPPNEEELKLLTPREKEILRMVAEGSSNDMISDRLCISRHTVKTHLYNIFKKVHVSNRLQAALWSAKNL